MAITSGPDVLTHHARSGRVYAVTMLANGSIHVSRLLDAGRIGVVDGVERSEAIVAALEQHTINRW